MWSLIENMKDNKMKQIWPEKSWDHQFFFTFIYSGFKQDRQSKPGIPLNDLNEKLHWKVKTIVLVSGM